MFNNIFNYISKDNIGTTLHNKCVVFLNSTLRPPSWVIKKEVCCSMWGSCSQNNLQNKKYYITIDMCIWNNNDQITNINNQQLRNFI